MKTVSVPLMPSDQKWTGPLLQPSGPTQGTHKCKKYRD